MPWRHIRAVVYKKSGVGSSEPRSCMFGACRVGAIIERTVRRVSSRKRMLVHTQQRRHHSTLWSEKRVSTSSSPRASSSALRSRRTWWRVPQNTVHSTLNTIQEATTSLRRFEHLVRDRDGALRGGERSAVAAAALLVVVVVAVVTKVQANARPARRINGNRSGTKKRGSWWGASDNATSDDTIHDQSTSSMRGRLRGIGVATT